MKKYFPVVIATAFLLAACNPPKQPTAKDILSSLVKVYSGHRSVSYDADYMVKPFNQDVAYKYTVSCKLLRDKKDPVFNGYVWLGNNQFERYYNLDKIYYINDSTRKIIEYNNPLMQSWVISSNLASDARSIFFLNPANLQKTADDTTLTDSLAVDKLDYIDYWKVTVRYPADKEFSDKYRIFWIDRNDTTLRRMVYHATYQGQDEYREWNIDSMKFDKVTVENLKAKMVHKLSSYAISQFISQPDTAKPFKGTVLKVM